MSFMYRSKTDINEEAPALSQRGRASMEFLGALQNFSSGPLRALARAEFTSLEGVKNIEAARQREDSNLSEAQYIEQGKSLARGIGSYRHERFLQRLVAEEVYLKGIPAMEECREAFEPCVELPKSAKGSLELSSTVPVPDYYDGVEWHLEPGGWDGYDLYGPFFTYVAGPYVFRHGGYAAVECGDNIIQQRLDVVGQLPKKSYKRIYEPGCGGFSTLAAAHKHFPEAELVGSDLSELLLRNGHIMAEKMGVEVAFKQRDARDTGESPDSFDAVLMYALLHEMPHDAVVDAFQEAFRIMKPGADIVISDPPPFRAVDLMQAVVLDWDTEHRGEPFFSAAAMSNWPEELSKIGFVDVEDFSLGKHGYPWVTRARKPD